MPGIGHRNLADLAGRLIRESHEFDDLEVVALTVGEGGIASRTDTIDFKATTLTHNGAALGGSAPAAGTAPDNWSKVVTTDTNGTATVTRLEATTLSATGTATVGRVRATELMGKVTNAGFIDVNTANTITASANNFNFSGTGGSGAANVTVTVAADGGGTTTAPLVHTAGGQTIGNTTTLSNLAVTNTATVGVNTVATTNQIPSVPTGSHATAWTDYALTTAVPTFTGSGASLTIRTDNDPTSGVTGKNLVLKSTIDKGIVYTDNAATELIGFGPPRGYQNPVVANQVKANPDVFEGFRPGTANTIGFEMAVNFNGNAFSGEQALIALRDENTKTNEDGTGSIFGVRLASGGRMQIDTRYISGAGSTSGGINTFRWRTQNAVNGGSTDSNWHHLYFYFDNTNITNAVMNVKFFFDGTEMAVSSSYNPVWYNSYYGSGGFNFGQFTRQYNGFIFHGSTVLHSNSFSLANAKWYYGSSTPSNTSGMNLPATPGSSAHDSPGTGAVVVQSGTITNPSESQGGGGSPITTTTIAGGSLVWSDKTVTWGTPPTTYNGITHYRMAQPVAADNYYLNFSGIGTYYAFSGNTAYSTSLANAGWTLASGTVPLSDSTNLSVYFKTLTADVATLNTPQINSAMTVAFGHQILAATSTALYAQTRLKLNTATIEHQGTSHMWQSLHAHMGSPTLQSIMTAAASGLTVNGTTNTAGAAFSVSSDQRIKSVISEVNDASALQKVRSIQPTLYNYVDTVVRGTDTVTGFMAQDVKAVAPEAVRVVSDWVPDVYRSVTPTWTAVGSMFKITCPELPTVSGVFYRFRVSNTANANTADAVTIDVIGEPDNSFIFAQQWTSVFCYGQYVNDFHLLMKDRLWALLFSGTQELDRLLTALTARVAALEAVP